MKWIILASVFMLAAGTSPCPKDVNKAIGECIGILRKDMARSNGMQLFMSVLDQTSELCSEDKLHKMFACLHKVYDECAQSQKEAKSVGLIIDPDRWEKTITNLCNSTAIIRENRKCEAKAKTDFQTCSKKVTKEVEQKIAILNNLYAQPESASVDNWNKLDSMTQMACLYTQNIQDCLRKPYKECPQMLDLLNSAIETFMLPACSTHFDPRAPSPKDNRRKNDPPENGDSNSRINENGDFVRDDNVIVETKESSAQSNGPAYRSNGVPANAPNGGPGGSGNVASSGRGRAPPLMGQAGKVTRDDSDRNGATGVTRRVVFGHGVIAVVIFAVITTVF